MKKSKQVKRVPASLTWKLGYTTEGLSDFSKESIATMKDYMGRPFYEYHYIPFLTEDAQKELIDYYDYDSEFFNTLLHAMNFCYYTVFNGCIHWFQNKIKSYSSRKQKQNFLESEIAEFQKRNFDNVYYPYLKLISNKKFKNFAIKDLIQNIIFYQTENNISDINEIIKTEEGYKLLEGIHYKAFLNFNDFLREELHKMILEDKKNRFQIKDGLEEVIHFIYIAQFGEIETGLFERGYLNEQYQWQKTGKAYLKTLCEFLVAITTQQWTYQKIGDLKLRKFFERRYGLEENALKEMYKPSKRPQFDSTKLRFGFINLPKRQADE